MNIGSKFGNADPFEFDKFVVVTIQGGGTYGLTLLGQLNAVIERGVNVAAIAGTSAGAVIAALIWSGWAPRDLRDRLGDLARQKVLTSLPGRFEPASQPFDFRAWASLSGEIAGVAASVMRGNFSETGRFRRAIRYVSAYCTATKIIGQLRPHYSNLGCFRGDTLECTLDALFREGLHTTGYGGALPDRHLTFRDFSTISRESGIWFPPLVLAATNLGTQNVEPISSIEDKYANIPVARAVRASAGYPVFFRPVDLPGLEMPSWFIDGGVISNFPAWAFSGDFRDNLHRSDLYRTLAYVPWAHIGLRLVDQDVTHHESGNVLPLYDYDQLQQPSTFVTALRRLLFGQARNRLEDMISKTLARSVIVEQPFDQSGGPDNLLDIEGINERRVHVMFAAGNKHADEQLGTLSFSVRSDGVDALLGSLVRRAQKVLDPTSKQADLRIRSNIFVPQDGKLRLVYACNMRDPSTDAEDPDVKMVFDRPNQGLTGFCYTLRAPLICNLKDIGEYVQNAGETLFRMSREQQAMVLTDRSWLASLPIFDSNDIKYRRKSLQPSKETLHLDQFASLAAAIADGPIFGVLNLDANIRYDVLGIDPNPDSQQQDDRIITVIEMMQVAALELGRLFGSEFGVASAEGDHDA